jgi:Restriction endonuclease
MAITATTVRYIKLGRNGAWERAALEGGEVHFGFRDVPHDLVLKSNFHEIRQHSMSQGRGKAAATQDAREIEEFYRLDETCLWITFAREHMWWTFAAPEVTWVGGDGSKHGVRFRKALGGWRNTDVMGAPLRMSGLSTKLTKVAAYRRTICNVEAKEYAIRRINGFEDPLLARSAAAREAMLDVTLDALQLLDWRDFETLVDLIFARSGWNRVSVTGGNQKLIDIELEQPMTHERAAVQVKSQANQKTLDDYTKRIDEAAQFKAFFFVCHTWQGLPPVTEDRDNVHVLVQRELAQVVLRTGLQDWVLEKIIS